jgi:hypothetical protein
VEACVWREVEVVGVGDVASLFPAWAFVWGDVDPHGGSLGAGEPDGSRNTCPGVACMPWVRGQGCPCV